MTIKGVLFDFSGTLFRVESTESWFRATLTDAGLTLPEPELVRTAEALERAGALPGGASPVEPPTGEAGELWSVRNRSAEQHRAAYTGQSRQVPLPDPALHDALYDRYMATAAWSPYPDAADVLAALRERGVAVGVVSNIVWDLRPVFNFVDHLPAAQRPDGLRPVLDLVG